MISIAGNSVGHWKDIDVEDKENFFFTNSCGYQKFVTKNFKISRDKGRLDYQIIYLIKGKGFYEINKKTQVIEAGNIILFKPGEPQHYSYSFKDETELYWVHFTGYAIQNYLDKLDLGSKQIINIGYSSECIDLLKKIIHELQIKRPLYNQYASALMTEVLAFIARKQYDMQSDITSLTNDIKKTLVSMHTRYNQAYSVEEYAKECNLSKFRFIHKFKTLTGMTPVEYITKIRIDVAKDLLSHSSLSVTEVSAIVGYENPLYFSRVFRKVTGEAPSIYKKHSF